MGLDLDGIGIPAQTQGAGDEIPGQGRPVHLGIGHQMGVVVAHRPVELAQQFHPGDPIPLAAQPGHHVGQFLAQGGGGGGLAMGA